ncbi:tetraacyldisaccharide 4'-kinase [Methylocystis parvus]|uniref:Tetraacyldisaccharide 4'-kinase n=1 Tax=Methylocystis parvus TaxID=134 RepID=A0A6B8MAG4_9HYPH|nr:tetraacyldisaccharide 4'-kinase [Methylocystis parvus]
MSAKCLPFTGRSTVEDRRVGSALTGFDEPSPHPTPLRGATLPVKGRDERVSSIDELNAYSADAVGDEALLLARHAMTIVGADRVAGAKLAQEKGATVLILDDGLQSRRLMPDLALLAIDSNYGAGNERCIPAGPLRAPLDAQLAAADALVVIGDGAAGKAIAARTAKPVFQAQIVPDVQIARELEGVRVVAFAGIGRPEKFFQTLRNIGAEVIETRAFPDHHRFGDADIADLKRLRSRCGARLVTTSKDAMRLRGSGLEVCALPISLALTNMDGLAATLGQAIERARAVRAS